MTEELAGTSPRRSFGERLVGAIKLDASVYEEIEHDPTAMGQAVGVVVLAAIAAGIGSAGEGEFSIVGNVIASLLGWLVSTAVIWLIGVWFMQHTSDYKELLRTLGFAAAPNVIAVLGFIPILGPLALIAAAIVGLIAYVIAVRQALDVTTGRAVFVCILAYLVGAAIVFTLILLLGTVGSTVPTA